MIRAEGGSSFNAAQCSSSDDIFRQEEVHQDDREDGKRDSRVYMLSAPLPVRMPALLRCTVDVPDSTALIELSLHNDRAYDR